MALGKCFKLKAKVKRKDGAQPVFKKKRKVPLAALEQINKELDRLEQAGILSKTDISEWAAPTVHVKKKSNQKRIWADFFTGLNDALQDHHYPLLNPEEIFNKLNGGKVFFKIDLSDAYIQIGVDEESSKLLCLYKYTRLAFGVEVAPAIFQQVMDTMLGDLDYATAYLNDILVTSKTTTEHWNYIINVFEKLQEYGFKVKEAKCDFFFLPEIKYLGHIIETVVGRIQKEPTRSETCQPQITFQPYKTSSA